LHLRAKVQVNDGVRYVARWTLGDLGDSRRHRESAIGWQSEVDRRARRFAHQRVGGKLSANHLRFALFEEIDRLRSVRVNVEEVRLQCRELLESGIDFVLRFFVRLTGREVGGREKRPIALCILQRGDDHFPCSLRRIKVVPACRRLALGVKSDSGPRNLVVRPHSVLVNIGRRELHEIG
jgi:hypothetical protein